LIYIAKNSPIFAIGQRTDRNIQISIAVFASIVFGSLIYSKIANKFRILYRYKNIGIKNILTTLIIFLSLLSLFAGIDRLTINRQLDSNMPKFQNNSIISQANNENCQIYLQATEAYTRNGNFCIFGKYNLSNSILLIGDSHAAYIGRAIISLGKTHSLNAIISTYQGCGFVLNNESFDTKTYPYLTQKCIEHNKDILNFVKINKPKIIILFTRSSSIMVQPNNLELRNKYNQLISKNIRKLIELNSNVIQIGPTPELIQKSTWMQKFLKTKSEYSRIPFDDNHFMINAKLTKYYLDTLKIFCPKNKCVNKSKKEWFFVDDNHLSDTGANMLLPGLNILLAEIKNNQSKE